MKLVVWKALEAKVCAGFECTHTFSAVFPVATSKNDWLHSAYRGSLDAARSLSDELLPGVGWTLVDDGRCRLWGNSSPPKILVDFKRGPPLGNTARAWLLAIIEAKILELEKPQ